MGLRGIRSASSALRLAQLRQGASANDVANSQTPGFKASRVESQTSGGGTGTSASGVSLNLQQGPIKVTGQQFDLGVQGRGFFMVDTPQGRKFSRAGNFKVNGAGRLVNSQGFPVKPEIQIPDKAESIQVESNGQVVGVDQSGESFQIGRVQLARFDNPEGLQQEGGNLFSEGANSGAPDIGNPGTGGRGEVFFGGLELSNTNFVKETVNQIRNENLFSLNIESLKASDEMLAEVVELGEEE